MRKHKLTKTLLKQYPNFTEEEYTTRRAALEHNRTEEEVEKILQRVFKNHDLHPESSSKHPFDYVWASWEDLQEGFIYRGRFDTTEERLELFEVALDDKTRCIYFQDTSHWRNNQSESSKPDCVSTTVLSTYFPHFTQAR